MNIDNQEETNDESGEIWLKAVRMGQSLKELHALQEYLGYSKIPDMLWDHFDGDRDKMLCAAAQFSADLN